eukprot:TRINITY_DN4046_c0_g1_i1.p1 TRINITY_DN4046_c0_g1~~TRINITY_DN4046_c0_g1_i1.p1  ORF type:complete len:340 (-),score=67.20 TRINITY_DN4046_c0_g1_i1:60-974(-)
MELESKRKELEEAKADYYQLTKKIDDVHISTKIKLNVGGTYFMTSLDTLRASGDSYLGALASGRHNTKLGEDGAFFIDRNPVYFGYILDFLRNQELILPKEDHVKRAVLKEAEYFALTEIIEILSPSLRVNSAILNEDQMKQLNEWIAQPEAATWELLYRATRDGFEAAKFHMHCNNKGPTITIIKSVGNFIFGGYTPTPWSSQARYNIDTTSSSFLFTLTNPRNIVAKFPLVKSATATFDSPNYGPTFGGGYDLHVCDCSDIYTNSYFGLPNSYADDLGYGEHTFTGSKNFQTSEIEVYSVKK